MKRLLIVFALMLAVATMMAPVSASAALFNESNGGRAAWEVDVGYVYTDVPTNYPTSSNGLPSGNISGWTSYYLPGGEYFNFNGQNLTHTGDFYYTPSALTLNIALNPLTGVSDLGFEIDPILGSGTFSITAYLGPGGTQGSITNAWSSTSAPFFYGWTDLPVYSLSIVSSGTAFGIGHMVEGGVGTAPVPEPATMLLLGRKLPSPR